MNDIQFANPSWSWALWPLLGVMLFLAWLDWRRADVLSRFVSVVMQGRLVRRLSPVRRWLSLILVGCSSAALIVALMRPQWGFTVQESPRVGAQIMFCLDVSKSMLAEDTAPNRLGRAKAEIADLLSFLNGDQVGLIAFAGRATVLCPMTPDYGFFKLILDGAGPNSVGRGGTRLEEPIRKALDGFRTVSDVSRILVLITDGEDHDSHPLDAAKAAAERGVKVLAIGFGDEAGSEIFVTDPQTGARTQVRDADGRPVMTRLDGQTLRDMALATDGAYIPAGTGALDLKSIYDAHIAPLVRGQQDGRARTIRNEGFQLPVLIGLVTLIASIVVGHGSVKFPAEDSSGSMSISRQPPSGKAPRTSAVSASMIGLLVSLTAVSQSFGAAPSIEPAPGDAKSNATVKNVRDTYNHGVSVMPSDLDESEKLLTDARSAAGTDGDVRFRATYNLGLIEAKRAEALSAEKPQDALAHLRRAADWFRDSTRLRPDHKESRHNLEVTMRRILELSDALAKKDERNLTQRLDQVINSQRALVGSVGQLVESLGVEPDPNLSDTFRQEFRQLGVQQRKIMADAQAVTELAREELDSLNKKKTEEQSAEDRVRLAQLTALLEYANRADQKIGQAHSQLRRRQAERSFRRASGALDELKRERDQLRGPVEVLDVLIADASSVHQLTNALGGNNLKRELPAWLTAEYIDENLLSLTERLNELNTRLSAAVDEQAAKTIGPPTAEQNAADEKQTQFLATIKEALPFLNAARDSLEKANRSIASADAAASSVDQAEALVQLQKGRERFLDLRGLVEVAYAVERGIQSVVHAEAKEGDTPETRSTMLNQVAAVTTIQIENIDRAKRIADKITQQIREQSMSGAESNATNGPEEKKNAATEKERLDQAKGLIELILMEMTDAHEQLQRLTAEKPDDPPTADQPSSKSVAVERIDQATELLEKLRRLFFSLVEHLQETAQRQANLNDETEKVVTLEEEADARDKKLGPLVQRQTELEQIAKQIGQALVEEATKVGESQAAASDPNSPPSPNSNQGQAAGDAKEMAKRYSDAGKLVDEGAAEMKQAEDLFSAPGDSKKEADASNPSGNDNKMTDKNSAAPHSDGRHHQDVALEKLVEALSLLKPPPDQNQQNKQEQQQNQQQEQQPQPSEESKDKKGGADPARMLQAIRDREAKRRRDQEKRQRAAQPAVDKDW